jgi:hypothetical protein
LPHRQSALADGDACHSVTASGLPNGRLRASEQAVIDDRKTPEKLPLKPHNSAMLCPVGSTQPESPHPHRPGHDGAATAVRYEIFPATRSFPEDPSDAF